MRLGLQPQLLSKDCALKGRSCSNFSVAIWLLTSSMVGPGVNSLTFLMRVLAVSRQVEPELFWCSQKLLELCFC